MRKWGGEWYTTYYSFPVLRLMLVHPCSLLHHLLLKPPASFKSSCYVGKWSLLLASAAITFPHGARNSLLFLSLLFLALTST